MYSDYKYYTAINKYYNAPIAQLDRASDYESAGRGFESLWAHHAKTLK